MLSSKFPLKEEEEHTPARPGKTYGNIYSDSQRTMKRNERDRKGHYDDGGYYDGPARPNMRDDNAKRNELSQNAEVRGPIRLVLTVSYMYCVSGIS